MYNGPQALAPATNVPFRRHRSAIQNPPGDTVPHTITAFSRPRGSHARIESTIGLIHYQPIRYCLAYADLVRP